MSHTAALDLWRNIDDKRSTELATIARTRGYVADRKLLMLDAEHCYCTNQLLSVAVCKPFLCEFAWITRSRIGLEPLKSQLKHVRLRTKLHPCLRDQHKPPKPASFWMTNLSSRRVAG